MSINTKYFISIVLAIYNEEGNIEQVIRETIKFLQDQNTFKEYEIIAVDDGSRDNTATILKKLTAEAPCLRIITHRNNLGYGKTMMSGVEDARYPFVFFMDADRQFDIREMQKMFCFLGNCDIIMGYRYKRKDPFYRIILAKIYSYLVLLFFGLVLKDVNCGFKLLKKEVVKEANLNCKGGAFYTEILLKAKNRGYRIKEVPVRHFPRLRGKQTGANPKTIFNAITDLVRLKYVLIINGMRKGGGR